MKKNVLITFDYEVFLGQKTGTIENCVIKPTLLILNILKENKAKAIFFVDATWLLFIKDNVPYDFEIVSTQLKDIVAAGSTVELHLHPQWKDAYIIENQIAFKSFKHYNLNSLTQEEIHNLFKRSVELLEKITLTKVCCFRAGGFCIEPFINKRDSFENCGIKYDFSVAPKIKVAENTEYDFDFSHVPNVKFYRFNNNIKRVDLNGPFMEIPLSVYHNNPIYRLLNKILLTSKKDVVFGDGIGIRNKSLFFFKSLPRRFKFSNEILTLDRTSNIFFKYLLSIYQRTDSPLVLISHPKMISKEALKNLEYTIKNFNTLNSHDLDKFYS